MQYSDAQWLSLPHPCPAVPLEDQGLPFSQGKCHFLLECGTSLPAAKLLTCRHLLWLPHLASRGMQSCHEAITVILA